MLQCLWLFLLALVLSMSAMASSLRNPSAAMQQLPLTCPGTMTSEDTDPLLPSPAQHASLVLLGNRGPEVWVAGFLRTSGLARFKPGPCADLGNYGMLMSAHKQEKEDRMWLAAFFTSPSLVW